MKPIAPGSIVFHPHRGYGVLTSVNLLTGWVGARFGSEVHSLDLSLAEDNICHADGEPILFRRAAPAYMPHGRLMEMVRLLHAEGYPGLYLYTWPKPSGLHWRWQLFTGPRNGPQFWAQRPMRLGWHGSGADYIFNPVMGWGDAPGASAEDLAAALLRFDPEGMARARCQDERHVRWFAAVCDALLPNYAYSLGWDTPSGKRREMPVSLPVMATRRGVPPWRRVDLPWPPGWLDGWAHHGYHRALRRSAPVDRTQ